MRRLLCAAGALGALALPLLGGTAHADTTSPSSSPTASTSATPAVAGNSFRTATQLAPGQAGQATGAIGDYFYWSFQASADQTPSITATVQLPPGTHRQGTDGWRLDVYDGLRRAQPCVSGSPQAQTAADATTVQLSCTLPSVRGWAETWSNAPLPGTYYVRLTVGDVTEQDLGLPFGAQLTLATPTDADTSTDGSLSAPLSLPSAGPSTTSASAPTSGSPSTAPAASSTGSSSGLFSGSNARWWWTGGGAVAAALTAVAGFSLTRHPRHWFS